MSQSCRLEDLETHLTHHLVVRLLEDPVGEPTITSSLTGHEIDVRDRDVSVRVTAVAVEMHDDVAGAIRRDLFR